MKIALIGYGKMGHIIEAAAHGRGHEIVSIIDINNTQDFDSEAFRSAEVAIEFTAPSVAEGNVRRCFEQGVKVVSGSTGWLKGEVKDEMQRLCREEGKTLLWSSNFSVGVAVFRAINRQLARLMNQFPQYDVNLEETHHVHKLDAPSGTAITLAEGIVEELDRKERWGLHETSPEVLRVDDIRRREVPGIHTVTYDSPQDLITITHSAYNREGFALGAVLAAEYLAGHEGWQTIDDVFPFGK
ncbi:MAG: 4-hydroxy-tetrahydrodipicolinate reductase [Bacteroidaceae bacterium]|nr:4-hydroxy-tetrahydrodipicolinate reductase [Bacteroidaceae bacterium]